MEKKTKHTNTQPKRKRENGIRPCPVLGVCVCVCVFTEREREREKREREWSVSPRRRLRRGTRHSECLLKKDDGRPVVVSWWLLASRKNGTAELVKYDKSYTLRYFFFLSFSLFCMTSHSTTTTYALLRFVFVLFFAYYIFTTIPNSSAAACPNGSFPARHKRTSFTRAKIKGEMANA